METVFRIDSDHGAWCSLLLPLTYTVISFKTLPKSYTLIVTSLLFGAYSIFLAISCDVLFRNTREKKSTEYIKRKASKFGIQNYAVITVLGLMLYSWLPIQEAILVCMCLTAYIFYLPRMFLTFQKSFTFGEGCLALQSLLLFVASSVQSFWSSFDRTVSIPSGYSTIAQIGLLSLILLCSIPVLTGLNWNPVLFYLTGAVIIGCFTIPFLWIKIQSDPVTWLTISVVDSPSRLKLIGIWLLCIFGAVLVVVRQLWNGEQATTSVRKYFHFFVVIVFTTGVYIDCELLFLSSVIVLCVQLLLEYVRALQIGPIAAYLDQAFEIFLDEKDAGKLILTNLYLLAGVSLPIWLTPDLDQTNKLILLSGVLSIGIGDSAASIVGSKFGQIKFPGSPKTLEGTLASIAAQLLFVCSVSNLSFAVVTSICFVSFVEAFTSQVDNVVLPLLLFSLFYYVL